MYTVLFKKDFSTGMITYFRDFLQSAEIAILADSGALLTIIIVITLLLRRLSYCNSTDFSHLQCKINISCYPDPGILSRKNLLPYRIPYVCRNFLNFINENDA